MVPLGLNSVTNTAAYGGRTCLPVLGFLSLMSIFFLYHYVTDGRKERGTRARVAENDVPFHRSARH